MNEINQQPQQEEYIPENATQSNTTIKTGTASAGWFFLGFFEPVVGLILFITLKRNLPSVSRRAGKGALIGGIILTVFLTIFYFLTLVNSNIANWIATWIL